MPKILVSMPAYREKFLAESVKNCIDSAKNPEDIYFSIVSEQARADQHADLSFIDPKKIIYRKYDLSEHRGLAWSRHKTTEIDFEYDYILYTCGHNLYAKNWDELTIKALKEAEKYAEKAIITSSGPEFEYNQDGTLSFEPRSGRTVNKYRPRFSYDYVPGYGFPTSTQIEVPQIDTVIEDVYLQGSWIFGPKQYVLEAPMDPDMGYHAEEIYLTVLSWCRGWRFFATPDILYFHDTYKEYPGASISRMATHRPWADVNQKVFWEHSDLALRKLNKFLSGQLHKDINFEKILEYCNYSGLNPKYCAPHEDYSRLPLKRHAEETKNWPPYLGD